ncbi:MAG: M20 aminoacylase family protein [Pseudomonadota bacterium]|nr:M20 aminoacylase family protein [Pseudomonadota bacterium]
MPVINRIGDLSDDMKAWRRYLHANPELGFECYKTSDFVKSKLKEFGVDEIHEGIAKTGVVAVIKGPGHGKTIALRADMDALPLTEVRDHKYKSLTPGVMHACGHDGHTAMLLGAARYLSESRNFSGQVVLIFQPAEEGGGGAEVMCKEGIMERFKIDSIYGIHNDPGKPLGYVTTNKGPIMASADEFSIRVLGRGGHAANPETSTDPIMIAIQLSQAIQTISSRNLSALERVVISITQIHGGTTHNIIPCEAFINGTVRTLSKSSQKLVLERLEALCEGHAAAYNGEIKLDFQFGYPPTVNHSKETEFAANVARQIVGSSNVNDNAEPIMAAEDFSFMIEKRPGAYLHFGQGKGPDVHNALYDFNDDLSPIGASFLAKLVEESQPIKKTSVSDST